MSERGTLAVVIYSQKISLCGEEFWVAATKEPPHVQAVADSEQEALDRVHRALEAILGVPGEYLGQAFG